MKTDYIDYFGKFDEILNSNYFWYTTFWNYSISSTMKSPVWLFPSQLQFIHPRILSWALRKGKVNLSWPRHLSTPISKLQPPLNCTQFNARMV